MSALRRLQRRVSELEEESRLQDADVSVASLQSELAHSLDGDQDQKADGRRDAPVSSRPLAPTYHADSAPPPFPRRSDTSLTDSFREQNTLSPEIQESFSHQPSPQEESLEPPKKRASLRPGELLEEEAEVARLQDEVWEWEHGAGCRAPPKASFSCPSTPLSFCPLIPPLPGSVFIPTNL